jgi:hypothetical protein
MVPKNNSEEFYDWITPCLTMSYPEFFPLLVLRLLKTLAQEGVATHRGFAG